MRTTAKDVVDEANTTGTAESACRRRMIRRAVRKTVEVRVSNRHSGSDVDAALRAVDVDVV